MRITFQQLIARGGEFAQVGEKGYANYVSELRRYLEANELSPEDHVPETFVADVENYVAELLPLLAAGGRLRTRASYMRKWTSVWTDLVTGRGLPRRFDQALNELMRASGVSQKALADHLGVDASTVRGYQKARHQPGQRVVRSLEGFFGLRAGVLGGRVKQERNGPVTYPRVSLKEFPESLQGTDDASSRLRTMVRKRLDPDYDRLPRSQQLEELQVKCDEVMAEFRRNKIISAGYGLPMKAWPAAVQADWNSLVAFKRGPKEATTEEEAAASTRKRVRIAKRQAQQPTTIRPGKGWGVRSVEYHRRIVENFFGYLVTPPAGPGEEDPDLPRGGKGLRLEEVNLGLFLNSSLLYDFVEFQSDRAGDYNTTSERIYSFATSLVHERRGWFRANPQLQERLTPQQLGELRSLYGIEGAEGDLWTAIADGAARDLRAYGSDARALQGPSRRAIKKLKPILDLEFPLDLVDELHELAETDINRQRDPMRRARLLADLVKSKILAETSLRGGHLALMRDGEHLRREGDRFYFVIPVHEYKNAHSAIFQGVGEVIYELPDPALQRWLKEYVDSVLPAIRSPQSKDYLFPVFSTGNRPAPSYIASRIRAFSKRYLKQTTFGEPVRRVGEFGTHAYRYVNAASLIKMEGGSVELAADNLLDTEDVAADVYAYILATRRHEKSAQVVRAHRARRKVRQWTKDTPRLVRG